MSYFLKYNAANTRNVVLMHFRHDIVQRRGMSSLQHLVILTKMCSHTITGRETLALMNNVFIMLQEADAPYGNDA